MLAMPEGIHSPVADCRQQQLDRVAGRAIRLPARCGSTPTRAVEYVRGAEAAAQRPFPFPSVGAAAHPAPLPRLEA